MQKQNTGQNYWQNLADTFHTTMIYLEASHDNKSSFLDTTHDNSSRSHHNMANSWLAEGYSPDLKIAHQACHMTTADQSDTAAALQQQPEAAQCTVLLLLFGSGACQTVSSLEMSIPNFFYKPNMA